MQEKQAGKQTAVKNHAKMVSVSCPDRRSGREKPRSRTGTECGVPQKTSGTADRMKNIFKLLIINPGSTSTKISLFENEKELFQKSQFHDAPVLLQFSLSKSVKNLKITIMKN